MNLNNEVLQNLGIAPELTRVPLPKASQVIQKPSSYLATGRTPVGYKSFRSKGGAHLPPRILLLRLTLTFTLYAP
ncbi:MAG: hypothetical protein RR090_11775 [Niameybacter sp.]